MQRRIVLVPDTWAAPDAPAAADPAAQQSWMMQYLTARYSLLVQQPLPLIITGI